MSDFIFPDEVKLSHYEFLTTEGCNSQCKYCFDNYFAERQTAGCPYMRPEQIPDLVSFIKKTRADGRIRTNFIGGEPLINFPFLKEFCKTLRYEFGDITFSMNTNILHLADEVIDFLIEYGFTITTSIDGLKETHDSYRGNWLKVVSNLSRLVARYREAGLQNNIGVIFVVNPDRVNNLYDDLSGLTDIYPNSKLSFNAEANWTEDNFQEFKAQLYKLYNDRPHKVMPSISGFIGRELSTQFCLNPVSSVTINPQGKLFFCHRLTPKTYNIEQKGFKDFYGDIYTGYYNAEYLDQQIKYSGFKECETCGIRERCKGGCRAVHYFSGKLNEKYCHFNKLLFELADMESKNAPIF